MFAELAQEIASHPNPHGLVMQLAVLAVVALGVLAVLGLAIFETVYGTSRERENRAIQKRRSKRNQNWGF